MWPAWRCGGWNGIWIPHGVRKRSPISRRNCGTTSRNSRSSPASPISTSRPWTPALVFAQQDKLGAVVDERYNGGGFAADYIIDLLQRDYDGYFNNVAGDRYPFTSPAAGIWGPKVMIINEMAGSGGDLMAWMFRHRKLGVLVGPFPAVHRSGVIAGHDPQLERAVAEALRMLQEKAVDRSATEPPPPTWGKRKTAVTPPMPRVDPSGN